MSKVANHSASKEGLSLRWRVTLWTSLVSLLIQALVGIVMFLYFRHAVEVKANARLQARAEVIAASLIQSGGRVDSGRLAEIVREATATTNRETQGVTLFDSAGLAVASVGSGLPRLDVLAGGSGWADGQIRIERLTLAEISDQATGDVRARVLLKNLPGTGTLAVVANDSEFEDTMSFTASVLLLTILLGLVATWTAAWLISGSVLRSLRQLNAVATSFGPDAIRKEAQIGPMPKELAEFQQQIEITREKLRESLCAQDRLISNVSHEMKTPIAVLLTEAETLDVEALPEDGRQFVRSVKQEVRRLGGIIDSFVQFSRVRGGMAVPEGRTCEVNEVLMDAVTACNASAARRGVVVRTELAADDQSPVVPGDADLLAGMFSHILGNCIRASEKGGEVTVRADHAPGRLRGGGTGRRGGGLCADALDDVRPVCRELREERRPARYRAFDRAGDCGVAWRADSCEQPEGSWVRVSGAAAAPAGEQRAGGAGGLNLNSLTLHRVLRRLTHAECITSEFARTHRPPVSGGENQGTSHEVDKPQGTFDPPASRPL